MNIWHIDTYTIQNGLYMIDKNMACIPLGSLETYNHYSKIKNSKIHTLINTKQNIKKGDVLLLYEKNIGYIAYGQYTNKIYESKNIIADKLPDISINIIYFGLCVKDWHLIKKPINIIENSDTGKNNILFELSLSQKKEILDNIKNNT